ncbi:MAG TPA: 2Fe-2S iron-sulfur cluster-binding protein [Candidatus Sulfotelmatobacter sp.]|nr:2Fe-2S iron-sulfur cluster-binding protein [Candidatus Sulfotelmatobacter sp.]
MSFTVRVTQFDEPFTVEMGETIVDAALRQGLAYPHSCRAGNCSTCKSELIAGEVDLMEYSEFALTDAERAAGKILACRAVPWSDCTVAYLNEDEMVAHPQRILTTRIVALEHAAHDVVVLKLAVLSGGPFTFSAGQYASLAFPGLPRRDFSMANAPGDEPLEFHIRALPDGVVSAYVATRAAVGDELRVIGPFGGAYLRDAHTGPLLLAGGGTGLAPILSIVRTALARDPQRPVELYVGVRDERDLYAEAELDALAAKHPSMHVHRILSAPSGSTARRTGFIHDAIAADLGALTDVKAYVAGPPVMVDAVSELLTARGLAKRDLHADAFFPAAQGAPA